MPNHRRTDSAAKRLDVSTLHMARTLCVTGALIVLAPNDASAYCRTTTCVGCERDATTGCTIEGDPIAWPSACISFSMGLNASTQVDLETARAMMREAFATWEAAKCDAEGRGPSIHISEAFGDAVCEHAEYNPTQSNANLILFRDDSWPYSGAGKTLATTSVSFYGETAQIYDADLEVNATKPLLVDTSFQKGFIPGSHDLLSILTHEAGHFLGIDHSRVDGSIMQISLSPGEVRRTLGEDDISAICAIYPPDDTSRVCDQAPRGGFSAQCALDPAYGGACSVHSSSGSPRAHSWVALASVIAMLGLRRRR